VTTTFTEVVTVATTAVTARPQLTLTTGDKSLDFDGSDDVVTVGNTSSLRISGDISVSAWVYFDDFGTATPAVISKITDGSNVGYGIEKHSTTNKLSFWIGDGTDFIEVTSGVLSATTWYHVVGTNDGTNSKIYINGALAASAAQGNPSGPTGDLKIGLHSTLTAAARYWDGQIDEVAVWSDVLTLSEVKALYNSGAGMDATSAGTSADDFSYGSHGDLEGYWKFNEGSGSTAKDLSGNGNNGTISGATYTAKNSIANYTSGTGSNTLSFTYKVADGHNSSDLDYAATSSLALNGGTILDPAGNASTLTLASPGASGSLAANKALIVDTTPATVSSVSSSTSNGSFAVDGTIAVTVQFSEVVNVVTTNGTPKIALETGSSDASVSYSSGTGTNTLTFTYTVATGHTSADLDYSSTSALTLNSGTIKDVAGNDATLTLASPGASGSLAANKALVVDGSPPTVSSVSATTSNGTFAVGGAIAITVTFSENVTVSGTPQLTLETGRVDAVVDYASGSGGTTLTFDYTVAADNANTDLDYASTSALALNSGTIRDAVGNNATLTLPSPGASGSLAANKALNVAGAVLPTISSVDLAADNSTIAVTMSEAVYNTNGGSGALEAADFALSISGGVATMSSATPTSISASGNVYTLGIGLSGTPNGSETLTVAPVDNGIYDYSGNEASTSQSNNTASLNDQLPATISSVSLAADNSTIAVTMSEAIYSTNGGSGAMAVSDFVLSVTGGTAAITNSGAPTKYCC